MAEVYWDLEWTLQQQGFDYAYDKRLYDRLREGHARPVREHFHAGLDYQDKLARFLENHDEPRAAAGVHSSGSPGRRRHHVSLARVAVLPPGAIRGTAEAHLAAPGSRACRATGPGAANGSTTGCSRCCVCRSFVRDAGNWSNACRRGTATGPGTGFLAFAWEGRAGERLLVTVNYAGNQSQCYVRLPFADLAGRSVRFKDLMSPASYDRSGDDVASRGLYLDLPSWGYHVFEITGIG